MASAKKNHNFPVLVSEEDLQSNPKFVQLLNILSNKITPDGTSIKSKNELEQAEIKLSQTHYKWLMSHIPYYELRELITDLELKSLERTLSPDEEQVKDVLSQAVTTCELEDYLSLSSNPTSGSTLFGLTQADVDRHNPVKHLLPALQQTVLPMLEDRLRKKCEELYDFFSSSSEVETVSDKLLLAKAQALSRLVEEKQQQLSRDKTMLKETQSKKNEHFLLCYQTLLESLSLMESLIKDYKFKTQVQADHIEVMSLEANSAAVVLKARRSQLQVICDTYTADNVKALKVIDAHLNKEIKETEKELASTRQALNTYYTLGKHFKLLVDEFSKLKTEVDSCKWGLQHFAKTDRKQQDEISQEHDQISEEFAGIVLTGAGPLTQMSAASTEKEKGASGGL